MPALLAWQYGVELSPTFRYKYLFSTRPWELLLVTFLLTTFGGAFVLHVLAFDAASGKGAALHYWEHLFIANDILTGLGYQHGPPPSAAARVIALALAWFGGTLLWTGHVNPTLPCPLPCPLLRLSHPPPPYSALPRPLSPSLTLSHPLTLINCLVNVSSISRRRQ